MSIVLTLATLGFQPFFSNIAYADTGSFTYNSVENGIMITGYYGEEVNLTIPQEIGGQAVVGINEYAFLGYTNLTSIVIPESVISIGGNAFLNCSNLAEVRFMGNAPTLGQDVFFNCSSELLIYYDPMKIGFYNPWNGYTAKEYIAEPEVTPIPVIGAVTGITLDNVYTSLIAGESMDLVPTIFPLDAVNKNIYWSSSDTRVVTVDETGTINAILGGNATITVTTEDGGFTAICSINVYNQLTTPRNELAVPQNYDTVKLTWTKAPEAIAYEIYRYKVSEDDYIKIATVQANEYIDTGLRTGTVYNYKIRSYRIINDAAVYSEFTPVIVVKTLNKSIGSSYFLFMSNFNNRNKVVARATELHYGDPSNTCALTVSEGLRRLGINIPTSTMRTNEVEDHIRARGWKREMNISLLQPGDICFTTDVYGHLLGGHSTHVFTFMSWANKEKTLMNICDNQTSGYGTVLHTRTIFSSRITDATAFFYHTNIDKVSSILKIPSTVTANSSSYNKVKISWKAAPSAYGYKIYRATYKSGSYVNIGTTSSSSITDTKVVKGKTYYYKVRAYNHIGSSIIYGCYSAILATKPV